MINGCGGVHKSTVLNHKSNKIFFSGASFKTFTYLHYTLKAEHFGISLSKIGPPVTLSWLKMWTKIDKKWLEKTALVKAISPEIAIFLAYLTNILCSELRICISISKILRKSIKSVHFRNRLQRGTESYGGVHKSLRLPLRHLWIDFFQISGISRVPSSFFIANSIFNIVCLVFF